QAASVAAAEGRVAVPDIADGDGRDVVLAALALEDGIEVLLAAAAHAEEGDADAFVGAEHLVVAGRGHRHRGADGGAGLEEIASILCHDGEPSLREAARRRLSSRPSSRGVCVDETAVILAERQVDDQWIPRIKTSRHCGVLARLVSDSCW